MLELAPLRRRVALLLKVCSLSFLVISWPSLAIGQQGLALFLAQQNATQLLILYSLSGLFVFLLLWLIKQKIAQVKNQQKLQQQDEELQHKQQLLSNFKTGMLHLNAKGEVIFANQVAAFLLGSKEQNLLNQNFIELFDNQMQERLSCAFASQQFVTEHTYLQASKRHLQLSISKQTEPASTIAWVIALADVSNFQHSINQQSEQLDAYNAGLQQLNLGQLQLDLGNQQFSADPIFAANFGFKQAINGELKQLTDWLIPTQRLQWQQALKQLSQPASQQPDSKQQFECTAEFLKQLNTEKLSGGSAPSDNKQPEVVKLHIVAHSSKQNDKGETVKLACFVQNLAEQSAQQAKYYLSQQQIQALLSANLQPTYVLDRQGKLTSCNPAFESLLKQRLNKLQGKSLNELGLFTDEINALHSKSAVSSLGAQAGYEKECQLILDKEQAKTVKLKLSYFSDQDKSRQGMVGVIHDLTELKHLQKQLNQERQHFTSIIDLAPISLAVIDADENIVTANIAMTDRLGVSERELKKHSFYDLFNDPENANKARLEVQRSARLRNYVAQLKGKNEQLFASELHLDVLNKDKQEYLCWISDRSKEQYHQDKFDSLLEHSSMPMAVLAEQGFSQLNPAACEFFKLEQPNALLGQQPFAAAINQDEQACSELARQVNKVKLDGQAKSLPWQHRVNGQDLPCHLTLVPMYKGQDFDSILCVWADLREIQQADEARLAAISLHQAAQEEAAEKQQLLINKEQQIASQKQSLAATESQLQAAKQDLSEKQHAFSDLQQAHKSVTDNLQQLQQDYNHNRNQLSQAQQDNAELAEQLASSTAKVSGLQNQRNQISDALQNSEKKYKNAQQALRESEQNAQELQDQQDQQRQQVEQYVKEIDQLKTSMQQKDKQLHEVAGQINSLQSQLTSSGNTSEKLRQLLVNQKKASEKAEQQRRQLEQTYKMAQTELSSKVRHVEHLQNEKLKLEEMSNQQKGDMQQLQNKLQQELSDKQQQLQQTQQALNASQQAAEHEKQARQKQQQAFERLQAELSEMEQRSLQQQQQMAQTEQEWQAQQQLIEQELKNKQQLLNDTQQNLNQAKEQTQAEKDQQQQLLAKLQSELAEVQTRSEQQQQKIAERDNEWQQQQQRLQAEVTAKREELQATHDKLSQISQQADAEKLARLEQQQKLEQLTVELTDVENRASKQQQMLQGSDEQWRKHHQEIEQQKIQLQHALKQAEQQNSELQEKLQGNLVQLQDAESQVTETKSTEQQLQDELLKARKDAERLQQRLQQQEEQEKQLQLQLEQQQNSLQGSQKNIQNLEAKQSALTAELQAVQTEYSQSKASLDNQQHNHSELSAQLSKLEQELKNSQQQLEDKEQALQQANNQLQSSQQKLDQQENQLLNAHKEELQQAKVEAEQQPDKHSHISKIALPSNPTIWFDLLPYLQSQAISQPLPVALTELIDELQTAIQQTDTAVEKDDVSAILRGARKLVQLATTVNSEALTDLVTRLENDCQKGLVDNIAIAWPTVQRSLNNTLRVIYSHLHQ